MNNGTVAICAEKTARPTVDSREAQEMSANAYVIRFKHPERSVPVVAASY
jgi:hypothetical protein